MASWTTPKTWVAGPSSVAELNEQIRDNTTWIKDAFTSIGQTSDSAAGQLRSAAYGCVLLRTASQSISDASDTAVTFPSGSVTEQLDSDGFHSTAVNTGRITIPAGGDGWYDIGGTAAFATNATGNRFIWIELNGSSGTGTKIAEDTRDGISSVPLRMSISTFYLLSAGDYVTMGVRQTSGGALDIQATDNSARFWCMRRFVV